ncbi:hypothetical protein [Phenylobacterium sp.]|uniref:hypothetical protein n=1 Tax=Phenylobacterium sp. TaxID=1871053 RepID=UPI00286A6ECF|nr:hypothetical protein [Phenylobacterium sp.]
MGRIHDPARAMRERLKALEARATQAVQARAVADGVAETVALGRARGTEFDKPAPQPRAGRATPFRRQGGLEWLAGKGRISARQRAAGEAYGALWRRVGEGPALGSSLAAQPGGGVAAGPSLGLLLKLAHGRARAQAELDAMRARLFGQSDLVKVCDLVCGQDLTPREAAGGAQVEAARIEAVLKVALDLLAVGRG